MKQIKHFSKILALAAGVAMPCAWAADAAPAASNSTATPPAAATGNATAPAPAALPGPSFLPEQTAVPANISTTETTGVIPRMNGQKWDPGVMGPPANDAIVAAADAAVTTPMAPGPFQPTWDSLQKNYKEPSWFQDAKFGIFMHWGLYSVAAYHNEWYEKHMYSDALEWHTENFGPPDVFGYKDLIPLFTAAKWDPDAWAALFKKSGAKYVIPTAEHHENFALWDSKVTPFNSMKMGPHRDLMADLAKAVRAQGLKFGVSNHGIENFTFIQPRGDLLAQLQSEKADLFDPNWAPFYHVADRSDAEVVRFLTDWVNRNLELIDKIQPDILWFDNGVNARVLDPLKLHVAAYYYNRALQWGKEVSMSTKGLAFAPSNDDTKQVGSIMDFEKVGTRSPPDIRPGPWQVDDPIGGNSWGYVSNLQVSGPRPVLAKLVDTVSRGGNFVLNISPMADGTIPDNQQSVLLALGAWLDVNGDAIYGTRAWTKLGEGNLNRGIPRPTAQDIRFTTKGDTLYAIFMVWPDTTAVITSLATGASSPGKVAKVELLGHDGALDFTQDEQGLKITLPADHANELAYAFKITGLKLQPAAAQP